MKQVTKLVLMVTILILTACTAKKNIISLPKEDVQDEKVTQPKPVDLKNSPNENPIAVDDDLQNQITPVIIGNVITENQSSLAFLNPGTIEKIYVRAGDHVKEGQILASLVNTQEVIDLQATEIKLKQKKLAVDLEKKKLERITEQFNAGILNKATLETEKNNYDSILLDLAEIQNNLKSKKYNLQMTKILAPYEGIISQKNNSSGDFVPGGTTVFQITQNKNMEIYAKVPGIYLDKLNTNMKLSIVSPNNKNELGEIKIRKVIPVLDKNSRTFDLYASITNFKGNLNPGDYVEIRL